MSPTIRNVCAALVAPLAIASAHSQAPAPITPIEQQMVASVDAHNAEDRALLEQIVNINSGTMNLPGVVAVKNVIAPKFEALGFKVRWVPMDTIKRAGDLVAEHPCPAGDGNCGKRLLLIGHIDTVFEPSSPFQKYEPVGTDGKIVTGPGADDMKGGIVVMLAALRAMKEAGALDHAQISIVLSGDEERHGDPVAISRRDMVEAAKRSDVALEFEPSGRFDGGKDSISVGRRSAGSWTLETTGVSGHSSQVFGEKLGYGAIYEMARILDTFRRELPEKGLTYNVGLVLGGTTAERDAQATGGTATGKSNIVAPITIVTGDIRTLDDEQTARVKARMQTIVAKHLPKTDAKITFAEGYPAMAATPEGEKLYQQWNGISIALGLGPVLEEGPITRGGGDIAFVAQYLPGLVGTGILGEGPHAVGETVYIESIASQAKRNAVLMERLGLQPAGK